MLQLLASHIRNNRAQSVVEFVLLAPVMIILLFGILNFGLVLNQQVMVTEAARQVTREISVSGLGGTITQSEANSTATSVLTTFNTNTGSSLVLSSVTLAPSGTTTQATVTISSPVPIFTPCIGLLLVSNPNYSSSTKKFTVSSSSNMMIE